MANLNSDNEISAKLKNVRTRVFFETMKTDECAIHYLNSNKATHVTIMNFASRHYHGGGYIGGAIAQEEDLCRVMPGLYPSLCRIPYPFEPDTVLITPDVEIMRDRNYELIRNKSYIINVVSCAAPNLRNEKFDRERIISTLNNMYTAVKKFLPDTDTLILGAWGCGAYGNDPKIMAQIMDHVNLKFYGLFKNVVFSVPVGVNTEEFRSLITLIK